MLRFLSLDPKTARMTAHTLFHPAVAGWFERRFAAPTAPQAEAWPAIQAGRHVLIAAPTGSGKTLAAFLAAIDAWCGRASRRPLADETQVVYVSPLKALSNDIQRNLEAPLAGIRAELRSAMGLPDVEIRTSVRTGDTPPARARPDAPPAAAHRGHHAGVALHPARLGRSGRAMLATTRTVIVDEIHALARDKRGAHLALSLERLAALAAAPAAAHRPLGHAEADRGGRALPGRRRQRRRTPPSCTIVDTGHRAGIATSRSKCRRRRSKR